MSWISGRSIRPESGVLEFWIAEDTSLPMPQQWEQLWQWCKGIEPQPSGRSSTLTLNCVDRQLEITSRDWDDLTVHLNPANYLASAETGAPAAFEAEPADVDPSSRCTSYRRTLTISVVNYEISESGDGYIETTGTIDDSSFSISIGLKTRGRNPSRATVSAALANDLMRALCWQESRWRHFRPDGTPLENRNTNGTADWGLMQINQATPEQMWNWKSNLSRAVSLLDEKRGYARSYLGRHPPYTDLMLENETIQRYNGGAYHRWDSTSSAWVEDPPNSYVASIRSILEAKPWSHLAPDAQIRAYG